VGGTAYLERSSMNEEDPFDLVPEEFYYSMSRDITDKDTPKFHWWEPTLYMIVLAGAFWLELNFFHVRL
jgi:hypothetical protein